MDTSNLTLLNAAEHHQLKYQQLNQYGFAAKEHAVPLLFKEIPKACHSFPILFSLDGPALPYALLSLEKDKNPHVQDDGSWQGKYIPLFYRRYPFKLATQDGTKLSILIAPDAPQLHAPDGEALYIEEDGQYRPSKALEEIKRGLSVYHETLVATKKLVTMLRDAGVLVAASLTTQQTAASEQQVLAGFAIVDPEKVNQLDSQTKTNWHKLGLNRIIGMHLNSIADWMPVNKP